MSLFSHPFSYYPKMFLFFLTLGVLGSGWGGLGCGGEAVFSGENSFFNPCTFGDDESCPQNEGFAQICIQTEFGTDCVNVCENAKNQGPSNGQTGDFCETDADCTSDPTEGIFLTCDNDQLGGGSTCRCVATEGPDETVCPVVDVAPGTVPFEGACDDDADCADGLPCIDCVCI